MEHPRHTADLRHGRHFRDEMAASAELGRLGVEAAAAAARESDRVRWGRY